MKGDEDDRIRMHLARQYYQLLDTHEYDSLENILDTEFTHHRPDMTIQGRDTFIGFMRDERPNKDTVHEIDGALSDTTLRQKDTSPTEKIAIQGRVRRTNGDGLFEFVDIFEIEGGSGMIREIVTYTQ